ncbi:hypothetical protein LINPERHAP1_LOCUS21284 [Linum perenne]
MHRNQRVDCGGAYVEDAVLRLEELRKIWKTVKKGVKEGIWTEKSEVSSKRNRGDDSSFPHCYCWVSGPSKIRGGQGRCPRGSYQRSKGLFCRSVGNIYVCCSLIHI